MTLYTVFESQSLEVVKLFLFHPLSFYQWCKYCDIVSHLGSRNRLFAQQRVQIVRHRPVSVPYLAFPAQLVLFPYATLVFIQTIIALPELD